MESVSKQMLIMFDKASRAVNDFSNWSYFVDAYSYEKLKEEGDIAVVLGFCPTSMTFLEVLIEVKHELPVSNIILTARDNFNSDSSAQPAAIHNFLQGISGTKIPGGFGVKIHTSGSDHSTNANSSLLDYISSLPPWFRLLDRKLISKVSIQELQKMMDKAIAEEKFEEASIIRDVLNKKG